MIQVSDKIYRGPRLGILDLEHDVSKLKQREVKTVINLQSGIYESLHEDPYEHANMLSDFGIYEVTIPCSDFTPPTKRQVLNVFGIVDKRGPVYLHCLHGKDRTGFMVAAYRMAVQGWSYEKAKAEMFSLGFHKIPYIWWTLELKKWAK